MNPSASTGPAPASSPTRTLGRPQLIWIAAILGVAIALTALTSDVTKASEPGIRLVNDRIHLPDTVGDWVSDGVKDLSDAEKTNLPSDTVGVRCQYSRAEGGRIVCTVVLAGRDVTSIHRPELCLPAQGWRIKREQIETIRTSAIAGGELKVMRMDTAHTVAMVAPNRPAQAIFVYWFVGKDRVTPYHWQRILWTTADRVLRNRNHRWAYVLLAASVRPEQTTEAVQRAQADTMRLLAGFVEQFYPRLREPPKE